MWQALLLAEMEQEKNFLRPHISLMWTLLHLVQFVFHKQSSDLWDQLEHLEQTGFLDLIFFIISCFWSSEAAWNPGQSLILFDIPSAPDLILYLWADLLQARQVLSPPWTAAVVLALLHLPGCNLLQEEHFCFSFSVVRAALVYEHLLCSSSRIF